MKKVNPLSLLVVDDLEGIRFPLSFRFESLGHTVMTATGGHEAWELLQGQTFDLVLTDLEMPGGDGLELLGRIKAVHPARPSVVLMTGTPDVAVVEIAYAMGAEGVLIKPFALATLDETIERVVVPLENRLLQCLEQPVHRIERPLQIASTSLAPGLCRIGRGGVFVMAEHDQPKSGSRVVFALDFAAAGRVECLGLVRWTRPAGRDNLPPGYGIEFDRLSQQGIDSLARLSGGDTLLPFIPRG